MGRTKKKKIPNGPCAYCGLEGLRTLDHVIPRCLFNKRIPNNIPTVLACHNCNNNQKSLDDDYLRDMLVVDRDAALSSIAQEIYRGPRFRALLRLQSATHRDIIAATPKEAFTASGILVQEPQLPKPRIKRIMSNIVRALSNSYEGITPPQNTNFDVLRFPFPAFESEMRLWQPHGVIKQVGDGTVFWCMYVRSIEQSNVCQWYLCFYERITYLILTDFSNLDLVY